MKRLALGLLFLALGFLSIGTIHASDAPPSHPAPVTDPTVVGDHFRQVLQRPEFQVAVENDTNTRFIDWLSQWFLHLGAKIGDFKYGEELRNFSLLLMAVLLVFTLAGFIYIALLFSHRRASSNEAPTVGTPGQKVFHPPEFYDEEIRRAINTGDWHAAWMVTWRQFLSRLESRQLVEADRTRTNREYLAQLREQSIPSPVFALLMKMVDAYDRFIYGRKTIDEADWNQFHQQVDEAVLLLHLDDKNPRFGAKPAAT